jgi:hypothetical protein
MATRPVTCHHHGVGDLHRLVTSHLATARLADIWEGVIPGAVVHDQFGVQLILGTARPPTQYHEPRSRQRHVSAILPPVRLMAVRPVTCHRHDVGDLAGHLPVASHTTHRGDIWDTVNVQGATVSCQLEIQISLGTLHPATQCHDR